MIIPRKTIIELQRLLEESDETVRLDIAASQVKLTFADIELVSKLVEGKFPDYTRVIPKGYKNDFTIGRDELLRSLQRAAIMTSDKFKGVRCIISPGSMKISSTNADQEEAVEELEIDYGGDIDRHRLQRDLPARRAEQPEVRPGQHRPGRLELVGADLDSGSRRLQVCRHADAYLRRLADRRPSVTS